MISKEFVAESDNIEQRFSKAFRNAGLAVTGVTIETHDDNWVKVTCDGAKHFKAGTNERLQFAIIDCWWEPSSDEINGKVISQEHSQDKKYSQIADFSNDQFTLDEFARNVNTFVSALANTETEKYRQGEKEYWQKGGSGMMPGSVSKDYR